jgi:hypothetical protein
MALLTTQMMVRIQAILAPLRRMSFSNGIRR